MAVPLLSPPILADYTRIAELQLGTSQAPSESLRCSGAMYRREAAPELPRSGTTRAPRAGMR